MKRIAAILLIAIFLFNTVGYRWVFKYLENKATQRLEAKIDAGRYHDDQLIEIKIPLQVPYYASTEYEPYFGETKFNGEHYRYVKRKVSGDTVYFLCIPHVEKNNIAAAKSDFIKAVNNDSQNSAPQKELPSYAKLMLSEFLRQEKINYTAEALIISTNRISFNSSLISQFDPQTAGQPPESI